MITIVNHPLHYECKKVMIYVKKESWIYVKKES